MSLSNFFYLVLIAFAAAITVVYLFFMDPAYVVHLARENISIVVIIIIGMGDMVFRQAGWIK